MKSVTLKLEGIGLYGRYPGGGVGVVRYSYVTAPWVCEISGKCKKYGFKRKFIKPLCDYSEANSIRSRGVYYYYHLFSGKVYQVYEHVTWKKDAKYYCHIIDGKLVEMSKNEVEEWIRYI